MDTDFGRLAAQGRCAKVAYILATRNGGLGRRGFPGGGIQNGEFLRNKTQLKWRMTGGFHGHGGILKVDGLSYFIMEKDPSVKWMMRGTPMTQETPNMALVG